MVLVGVAFVGFALRVQLSTLPCYRNAQGTTSQTGEAASALSLSAFSDTSRSVDITKGSSKNA
jgi:hypothetical protein